MQLILLSACLAGQRVRYNAADIGSEAPLLSRWRTEGRVIPFCPEVAAGLAVPRPAAEISGGEGLHVLQGVARVLDTSGADVSEAFICGAEQTLAVVKAKQIRLAILKEGSPSCGSSLIYDGSFSGRRISGAGVTAERLRQEGIRVFSELQLDEAEAFLQHLERTRPVDQTG
jgi:uncharacterized protein YbbK (DUF523 family)